MFLIWEKKAFAEDCVFSMHLQDVIQISSFCNKERSVSGEAGARKLVLLGEKVGQSCRERAG